MDGKLNVAVGQCPAELVGPQARYDWLKKTLDNIDGQRLDLLILPELFLTGYNVGERLIEWGEAQEGPFCRTHCKTGGTKPCCYSLWFCRKRRKPTL